MSKNKLSTEAKFTEVKEGNLTSLERHFNVEIKEEAIAAKVEDAIDEIAKTYELPKFRKGKVPRHLIEYKHKSSIRQEVVTKEVEASIAKIIEQNNFNLYNYDIDKLNNQNGVSFLVKLNLMPEITIPNLSSIELEKPIVELSESDMKKAIDNLRESKPSFTPAKANSKAQKGDQLIIDFEGFIDGAPFKGGKAEDFKIVIGSNQLIPGFEDQLIGLKKSDEKVIEVTFPENYHEKTFAGKPAEFKINVKEVNKADLPEVNDEFAKLFNFKNIEELKKEVKLRVTNAYNQSINSLIRVKLFDKLEALLKFEVPKALLEQELHGLKQQFKDSKEDYTKIALRRTKIGLMLSEYARVNNLKISQADLRDAIIKEANMYPGQERQIIEFYQKNARALNSLKGPVMEDKAVTHIFENHVKFKEKKYTATEIDKMLDEE